MAIPKCKEIWLVFDLSNGDQEGKSGYIWWFTTKEAALEHIRHQKKMKYSAKLSKPTLWWKLLEQEIR